MTPLTPKDAPVEVTAEDREAANNWMTENQLVLAPMDYRPLVQAFARHRLAFSPTPAPDVSEERARLIERLRSNARAESRASRMLAGAKSLRQTDNPEQRDDLYSWAKPEDTDSWKAADMLAAFAAQPATVGEAKPIDMVLHCPKCGEQHIDEPDADFYDGPDAYYSKVWTNPPHRSHLCHGCGCIWRPADVATNGVHAVATVGKADNWNPATHPEPVAAQGMGEYIEGRLKEGGLKLVSGSPTMLSDEFARFESERLGSPPSSPVDGEEG